MHKARAENPNYGRPRIHLLLKEQNIHISSKTLDKLYAQEHMQLKLNKKGHSKYKFNDKLSPWENLLLTNKPDIPFDSLVTDGLIIKAGNQSYHIAFVMDLYSRFIICYYINIHEDGAFYNTLLNKLQKLLPNLPLGSKFHTDQGSVFTSKAFSDHVKELGFIPSMSKKGCPTDNAVIENFHGILQREIYIYLGINNFKNYEQLVYGIEKYVNYYLYKRIGNDNKTPFMRLLEGYKKDIDISKITNYENLLKILKTKS